MLWSVLGKIKEIIVISLGKMQYSASKYYIVEI